MAKRLILWTATILAVSFLVSGCNTVQGMGRDIRGAGQGIENAASH